VVVCKFDVKGCAYNKVTTPVAKHFGYGENSPSKGVGIASFAGFIKPASMSYSAVHKDMHNPKMQRFPEMFILANTTVLPEGYIPKEIMPTYLNLATDDTERLSRRDLLAEVFLATGQDPHKGTVAEFAVPDHIKPIDVNGDVNEFKAHLLDVVSYNIFNMMFGLKPDKQELGMLSEWLSKMNPIAIALSQGDAEGAAEVKKINEHFFERVQLTKIGRDFITRAAEQKMDGVKRLKEMVMVLFFAGVGGTSVLTECTMNMIMRERTKLVPEWKKDPQAVLLEGARLYPPVAGHNPMKAGPDNAKDLTFASGRKASMPAGSMHFSIINAAHHDPAIFGGPSQDMEYAKKFIPGRENSERILTWGAELAGIKSCPTSAGCKAAPRPCPGAFLSQRVAKGAISFFVDALKVSDKEL